MLIGLRREDVSGHRDPCERRDAGPPFFELEELIAQGYDQATALAIMAARRGTLDMHMVNPFEPTPPVRITA